MILSRASLCIMLAALPLAACEVRNGEPSDQPANGAAPAAPETTGGVTRVEAPANDQPVVVPMPAQTVMQSQPGPDGSQVDLLKVAVTGDILTLTLRCSSPEKYNSELFKLADISVIDDATSQKLSVLKDNEGKWLASDLVGDSMRASCTPTPGIMWAKFPAPPATSKTISINLPKVAPFDGVPVTR